MKRAIARKSKFDPIKLIRPAATDEEGGDSKSKLVLRLPHETHIVTTHLKETVIFSLMSHVISHHFRPKHDKSFDRKPSF
jgi:hypothetical protein